jgi:hypothetical protein
MDGFKYGFRSRSGWKMGAEGWRLDADGFRV